MNLSEVLHLEIFRQATVRTTSVPLTQQIDSVMVLEAADIECWGKANQLLLTSYFALHEMSEEELKAFIVTIHKIKIAGIILKLDRLVTSSPEHLVNLCNQYQIPLIEISKDISYEKIIVSIYEPLINYQSFLLRAYYETNQTFSNLRTEAISYQLILDTIVKLIGRPCRLVVPHYDIHLSSGTMPLTTEKPILGDSYSSTFTKNNYELFEYVDHRYIIHIGNHLEPSGIYFYIDVLQPHFGADEVDVMILESAMEFFQNELYKEYYIKQERYIMLNNIAASILFNTSSSEEELDSLLEETTLHRHPYYQAVGIIKKPDDNLDTIREVRKAIQNLGGEQIYYENRKYVIIIFNHEKETDKLTKAGVFDAIPYKSAFPIIITDVRKRWNMSELYKQCMAMYNFNKDYFLNYIIEIKDLGIFRYLGNVNEGNQEDFVPEKLISLHNDHPDLFETFYTFMLNNRNYKQTADALYLHPKTIRYRIDKIIELTEIDLNNPMEILNFSTGAIFLKYRDNKLPNP